MNVSPGVGIPELTLDTVEGVVCLFTTGGGLLGVRAPGNCVKAGGFAAGGDGVVEATTTWAIMPLTSS